MNVEIIRCLQDNYSYLIIDKKTNSACVVDPSESKPIIEYLDKHKIKLIYILNTHHHYDHIGGNKELKKKYKAEVVGYAGDKNRIPGIDICFYFFKEKILFTGDTLFSLGCGRLFEGSYEQMLSSLNILKTFPLETKVYCGHEYTLQNSKFCIKYDSNNKELKEKIISIKKKLSDGLPTIPSTIKEELECNIFLRFKDKSIQQNLNSNNSLETFSKLRDLKDNF
jgi:hydroxyacylglutathione hydrolase